MIDVAIAIDVLAVSMIIERKVEGDYNERGDYVIPEPDPEAEPETISAAIQPVKGFELVDVPEGVRSEISNVIWSRSDISEDDVIKHQSISYRVLHKWPRPIGNYTKVAVGMVK